MNKAGDLMTGEVNVSSLNIWCSSLEFHFCEEKLTVEAYIRHYRCYESLWTTMHGN